MDKYYVMCNHWSESGIGYAFREGYVGGDYIENCYSSIYSINKIIEELDEYPYLKIGLELDVYAYEEIQKIDVKTIEKIKEKIDEGRISIEGLTYGQPLGQDYSWESNIQQILMGIKSVEEIFGVKPKTFLVEEQWFHPQLPQILKKCGVEFASFQWQNSGQIKRVDESYINWVGKDGTKIVTIPSNQNMISCVTQYYDYENILSNNKHYENQLIFQWIEVWAAGMDWGSSIKPYDIGIKKAKEIGCKFTTLTEYFEKIKDGKMNDHYFSLNDSNYGNDWYQGGGWGFNGDRIIRENNICESLMYIYNNFECSQEDSHDLWKRILMLQNHDASVARSYRCITDSGIETTADSYFIQQYREIGSHIAGRLDILKQAQIGKFNIINNGFSSSNFIKLKKQQTQTFTVEDGSCFNTNDYVYINTESKNVDLKMCESKIEVGKEVTGDNYSIKHKNGWEIEAEVGDKVVSIELFSGEIGKANEHDQQFYALSPDHKNILFAFNGNKFCYDQRSDGFVKSYIKDKNILIIESELLNLRHTNQAIGKAKAYIFFDELTNSIKVENELYLGVPMNINASTNFKISKDEFLVDYPFGEEKVETNKLYTNRYMRLKNNEIQIISDGSQRVLFAEDSASYTLTKGRLHGKYKFDFTISFGVNTTKEAMDNASNFIINNYLSPTASCNTSNLYDNFAVTYRFYENDSKYIRLLNNGEAITFDKSLFNGTLVDFQLNEIDDNVVIKRHEIITIKEDNA